MSKNKERQTERQKLAAETKAYISRMALNGFRELRSGTRYPTTTHHTNHRRFSSYNHRLVGSEIALAQGRYRTPTLRGAEDTQVERVSIEVRQVRGLGRAAVCMPFGLERTVVAEMRHEGNRTLLGVSSRGDSFHTLDFLPVNGEPDYARQLAVAGALAAAVQAAQGCDLGVQGAGELFERWGSYRDLSRVWRDPSAPYWTSVFEQGQWHNTQNPPRPAVQ